MAQTAGTKARAETPAESRVESRVESRGETRLIGKALLRPGIAVRVLRSRWLLRHCASVGRLPRIYGKLRLRTWGRITIGEKLLLMGTLVPSEIVAQPGGVVEIGDRVFINYGVSISAHRLVRIGNRCQIGNWSMLMDNDYHWSEDPRKPGPSAPIILEDDVWLGARVIVLKGVTIGRGAVIGAGSVVTRCVPPRSVAVGAPARVVRTF
ncbi:MAG TPA: acyltransferase [Ktedonobacterales bacterium]|nr:acyltransferase [Ktedonobacterales bacterium]